MNQVTILFHKNGLGSCFYTEAIPLATLGRLRIHRVTSINWNPKRQTWEVRNKKGKLLHDATSREACIEWEKVKFNT